MRRGRKKEGDRGRVGGQRMINAEDGQRRQRDGDQKRRNEWRGD